MVRVNIIKSEQNLGKMTVKAYIATKIACLQPATLLKSECFLKFTQKFCLSFISINFS